MTLQIEDYNSHCRAYIDERITDTVNVPTMMNNVPNMNNNLPIVNNNVPNMNINVLSLSRP